MVKIYKQPFAHDGDAIAIPDASQPDGKMSSADGWTPDYQLPKTDPNYKPVGRQEMNGVFKEVTEALGQIQQFGFADWQNITGGWPIGANVRHADGYWQSLANANTEEPGTGALWKELLFDNLVPASEPKAGVIEIATQDETDAGTDHTRAVTPKTLSTKLASALAAQNVINGQKLNRSEAFWIAQSWNTVTAQRAPLTDYTAPDYPIDLYVAATASSTAATAAIITINGLDFTGSPASGPGNIFSLLVTVPAGAIYSFRANSGNYSDWVIREGKK